VVGDGGTVLKSTDAGLTWCTLNLGSTVNLHAVLAVSSSVYLVAGDRFDETRRVVVAR
jgi:photosystem II stability/assembly factor-like uncharacterized protein